MLRLELGEPRRLALPAQLRLGPLGQCHAPRGVTFPRGARTELVQAVGRVLSHHLEQVVPCLPGRAADEQERCIRQALDAIQRAALVTGEADLGNGRERCATPEHRQSGQQAAVLIRQQVVAPVEGLVKRLLPGRQVVGPAGEEAQTLRQPVENGLRAQGTNARGGELDRQREPVDASAELANRPQILLRDPEVGLQRAGSLLEEGLSRFELERGNRKDVLAGEMQDGSARDEDRQARRSCKEPDEGGRRLLDVLGVVEQEQELLGAEGLGERLERLRDVGDAERLRDGRHHELRVTQRGELDEHGAVRVGRGCVAGGFESQPGLAASACAGEDDQACVSPGEEVGQLGELRLAAYEEADRRGQRFVCRTEGVGVVQARVVAENLLLQRAQRGARLEPELVAQRMSERVVVLERVGLSACPVEREHRLCVQPLAQRVVGGEREDLTERLVVTAEGELRVDPLLERDQPQLLEALGFGLGELLVGELAVGTAAPEAQRLVDQRGSERRVAGGAQRLALSHETLESVGVEQVALQLELVGARARHDPNRRRQRLAQLRDVHLHQLRRRRGSALSPDRIDELVDTTGAPIRHNQRSQQPALLPRQHHQAIVTDDLDRPQDTHLRRHGRRSLNDGGADGNPGGLEARPRAPRRRRYTRTEPASVSLAVVPYAFVEDIAASWEHYQRFAAALEGPTPEGLILHAAGPTDEGFRIIGVWESEDAWQRFRKERLDPDAEDVAQIPPTFRALRTRHIVQQSALLDRGGSDG